MVCLIRFGTPWQINFPSLSWPLKSQAVMTLCVRLSAMETFRNLLTTKAKVFFRVFQANTDLDYEPTLHIITILLKPWKSRFVLFHETLDYILCWQAPFYTIYLLRIKYMVIHGFWRTAASRVHTVNNTEYFRSEVNSKIIFTVFPLKFRFPLL